MCFIESDVIFLKVLFCGEIQRARFCGTYTYSTRRTEKYEKALSTFQKDSYRKFGFECAESFYNGKNFLLESFANYMLFCFQILKIFQLRSNNFFVGHLRVNFSMFKEF